MVFQWAVRVCQRLQSRSLQSGSFRTFCLVQIVLEASKNRGVSQTLGSQSLYMTGAVAACFDGYADGYCSRTHQQHHIQNLELNLCYTIKKSVLCVRLLRHSMRAADVASTARSMSLGRWLLNPYFKTQCFVLPCSCCGSKLHYTPGLWKFKVFQNSPHTNIMLAEGVHHGMHGCLSAGVPASSDSQARGRARLKCCQWCESSTKQSQSSKTTTSFREIQVGSMFFGPGAYWQGLSACQQLIPVHSTRPHLMTT